ncbi:MAG: hypothetical protein RIQ94_150 [Pseudomonadota bacterium]|jgi:hypothetical protein
MNDLHINYNEDKQTWDNFASLSPQRSIFVYSKFLHSLQVNYDLVTCYEKKKIVAGAVLIYTNANEPIKGVFPFTQYQGLLLADNTQKAEHSQLTHEFKVVEYFISQLTHHYKKFCYCHSWRLRDLRPFQWHNYHEPEKEQFKIDLRYTGLIDLQKFNNFEEYLTSVRTVRRQEYKKSSQVLQFEFSDDISLLDTLHAKTFERQHLERSNQDSVLLRSICKHALAGGYGKMCIALSDNIPISAVLFIYDDRSAYYLFGANDPSFRNTGAGAFLLMQMIKDAFDNGIKEVDFVGVNSPNRGDFKISFGLELKPYFITTFS